MYVRAGTRNRRLTLHGLINIMTQSIVSQYHAGLHLCVWWLRGEGYNLAEPDPYAGGEGLVTCYTQSL